MTFSINATCQSFNVKKLFLLFCLVIVNNGFEMDYQSKKWKCEKNVGQEREKMGTAGQTEIIEREEENHQGRESHHMA